MKRLVVYKVILITLALCGLMQAQQFTSVSATITDPSSQVWSNAIITANLIPAFQKPGPSLNQGHAITDGLQFLQADGSGTFSLTVDDNTFVTPSGSQWAFTICSNTSAQCTTITTTISGASQNISGTINAAISNLVVNAVPTILRAYNGVEATGGNGAIYWRTTDNTFWGCNALPNQYCSLGGGTWIQIGGGGGGGGVVSVGLAGPTGIVISGSPVTTSGTLTWSMPVGWSTGSLLIGNGSNSVTNLAIGSANTVLESDGTTAHWQSLMFPAIFYQHVGVNSTTQTQRDRLNLIAGTGITITGADSSGTNSTNVTISNSYLPCQTGIGDGANAIPAGTYHQIYCKNDSGGTITLHGISCATDNNGSSTMNVSDSLGNPLLSGAITCTNTFANGTQSGTTTIASGVWMNFTFVSDGVSTQTTWAVH